MFKAVLACSKIFSVPRKKSFYLIGSVSKNGLLCSIRKNRIFMHRNPNVDLFLVSCSLELTQILTRILWPGHRWCLVITPKPLLLPIINGRMVCSVRKPFQHLNAANICNSRTFRAITALLIWKITKWPSDKWKDVGFQHKGKNLPSGEENRKVIMELLWD